MQDIQILLETSGAHDISKVDPRVHRIMDLKTPGSGEVERNLWSNIEHLTLRDEVKFVIGSREDYKWSRDKVRHIRFAQRCHAVLFSPIFGRIDPRADCRMDSSGQTRRSVSIADAQIHLDVRRSAECNRCVRD